MEDQTLNLSFTVNEVNIILSALGEMPAKASMPLIQKIQQQAGPQIAPPSESVDEE